MIDNNINISWYSNLADSSYQELQNLTNILKKRDFKDIKFPGKTKEIHKIEKTMSSTLVILYMKIRKKDSINVSKNVKKNVLICY